MLTARAWLRASGAHAHAFVAPPLAPIVAAPPHVYRSPCLHAVAPPGPAAAVPLRRRRERAGVGALRIRGHGGAREAWGRQVRRRRWGEAGQGRRTPLDSLIRGLEPALEEIALPVVFPIPR